MNLANEFVVEEIFVEIISGTPPDEWVMEPKNGSPSMKHHWSSGRIHRCHR